MVSLRVSHGTIQSNLAVVWVYKQPMRIVAMSDCEVQTCLECHWIEFIPVVIPSIFYHKHDLWMIPRRCFPAVLGFPLSPVAYHVSESFWWALVALISELMWGGDFSIRISHEINTWSLREISVIPFVNVFWGISTVSDLIWHHFSIGKLILLAAYFDGSEKPVCHQIELSVP